MTTRALAAKYIREQLEIMRKHGGAPKLDKEQRQEAVAAAQKTFETMRTAVGNATPRTSPRAVAHDSKRHR